MELVGPVVNFKYYINKDGVNKNLILIIIDLNMIR